MTLAVVWDKLPADPLLEECTCIPIDNLIVMGSELYLQEEGLAIGSYLIVVIHSDVRTLSL